VGCGGVGSEVSGELEDRVFHFWRFVRQAALTASKNRAHGPHSDATAAPPSSATANDSFTALPMLRNGQVREM
jgi:hypothetical protein